MTERVPPEDYEVFNMTDGDYARDDDWSPNIAESYMKDRMTRDEAIDACLAHHNAIEARTRVKVLAQLIAWLRTDDNTSSQWIADEIERIAYKGAMERAKGEGE